MTLHFLHGVLVSFQCLGSRGTAVRADPRREREEEEGGERQGPVADLGRREGEGADFVRRLYDGRDRRRREANDGPQDAQEEERVGKVAPCQQGQSVDELVKALPRHPTKARARSATAT